MLLLLVEDLARRSARHSTFPHNNRRVSRVYCWGRRESFRQWHRGSREEGDDHNVDWFPWRTLHEYVEVIDSASDRGKFDLRACHVGFQGHGKGRRTVLYYLSTTLLAVILGIVLVVSIRPGESGNKQAKEQKEISGPHRNLDSFLDLIR